ncbi:MAG: homogentisate 1,2-dioxygenase [Deltaproteobacteria bacterium]|nr:homogentisate 1,2-dioxygenase [Deltaproteobacteria bacterium]
MPFYHTLGTIPHKRHTQFRKKDGTLYQEELMGTRGFSGVQSILYHHGAPTAVLKAEIIRDQEVELLRPATLEHRHLVTAGLATSGDPITSRLWLFANPQIKLGLATPTQSMNYFYRNAQCDELIFVHHGSGTLHSQFGSLPFRHGDYIVLPVGVTYQLECKDKCRLLVLEANSRIEVPQRYRNEYGQLLERSPFCERDIRVPQTLVTHDERGEFEIQVRTGSQLNRLVLDHHPFDVVGWDGYLYPWIFNIEDFEPITGRVHQPPPVHQTFAGEGFVVCSFVPRMYDYHPEAVPVPYNHSNVNSDEVLYYVAGDFMSRKGIKQGSFTLHPAGLPHGPHPGTVEKSLGQKDTKELAVMVDTFAPLHVTKAAAALLDPEYVRSWLDKH